MSSSGPRERTSPEATARVSDEPPSRIRSFGTLAPILILCALNCVIWFFMSLLAVGGDGDASGIFTLWLVGFPIIAIATVTAMFLRNRGRFGSALLVACSPLPLAYGAIVLGVTVSGAVGNLRANVPEMEQRCRLAGVEYVEAPATPVGSVAYDWKPRTSAPRLNFITMDARGNIQRSEGGSGRQRFPAEVTFLESRCCRYHGGATTGQGDFIRQANDGTHKYVAVPELTADALVYFTSSEISLSGRDGALTETVIVVSDRRDGRRLASLRYVMDEQARRICGTTSPGVLDEQHFVIHALGLDGK
jgi:hypothetical protein